MKKTNSKNYNGETLLKEIGEKYGIDFGCRADKKLVNYLREKGYPSLAKLIKGSNIVEE